VGLVFEHDHPVLAVPVYIRLYQHGAGVYLLRGIQILKAAPALYLLGRYRRHIHKGYVLIAAVFIKLAPHVNIHLPCLFYGPGAFSLLYFHLVKTGKKCSVAAVIRPICVYHLQLRYIRVASLFYKIVPHEFKVRRRHGKAHALVIGPYLLPIHFDKALNLGYRRGRGHILRKAFRGSKRSLPRLHGVYRVFFYCLRILRQQLARKHIHLCAAHAGGGLSRQQRAALRGGIGTLVKLPRKIFHGIHIFVFAGLHAPADGVGVRLRKYSGYRLFQLLCLQPLHIVAVYYAKVGKPGYKQVLPYILKQRLGLHIKARTLFNKNSLNAHAVFSVSPVRTLSHCSAG